MKSEIKEGSRVRVEVTHRSYHKRNFSGTVKKWTKSGKLSIVEDGTAKAKTYSSENVKLIKQ